MSRSGANAELWKDFSSPEESGVSVNQIITLCSLEKYATAQLRRSNLFPPRVTEAEQRFSAWAGGVGRTKLPPMRSRGRIEGFRGITQPPHRPERLRAFE